MVSALIGCRLSSIQTLIARSSDKRRPVEKANSMAGENPFLRRATLLLLTLAPLR